VAAQVTINAVRQRLDAAGGRGDVDGVESLINAQGAPEVEARVIEAVVGRHAIHDAADGEVVDLERAPEER
jgi:hypothetical protein